MLKKVLSRGLSEKSYRRPSVPADLKVFSTYCAAHTWNSCAVSVNKGVLTAARPSQKDFPTSVWELLKMRIISLLILWRQNH